MKNNILILSTLALFAFYASSCTKMEDNFKQYKKETIYPGKVNKLKGTIGIESVYLSWIAPSDPKSQRIIIKWTKKDSVVTFGLRSDTVIRNLSDGLPRNFEVSSVDAYGNRSIVEDTILTPFTKEYIKQNILEPPVTVKYTVSKTGDTSAVYSWTTLKTTIVFGSLVYKYKDSNKEVSSVAGKLDAVNGKYDLTIIGASKANTLEYTIGVIPLLGTNKTYDTVKFVNPARVIEIKN